MQKETNENLIKLTSFCIAKEATDKTQRQPTLYKKDICKRCNQRLNFQNTQTAYIAQQTTQPKNGQKNLVDIYPRRYVDSQVAHEMLSVTSY